VLPAIILKSVVFPEPFGPIIAMRSLTPTLKVTALNNNWSPKDFDMSIMFSIFSFDNYTDNATLIEIHWLILEVNSSSSK
jgi:hypothetical protein